MKEDYVIKDFTGAVKYLYDHIDYERIHLINSVENDFKLDRTLQMLAELGQPHYKIPVIHIAGTKGKGSTVAMLVAGLRGCGLRVGAFTSPHLVDIRERITIDGDLISKDDFTDITRRLAGVAVDLGINESLHFFEIITVMAFEYFCQKAVDIAVIETGLGGRLDCTNVVVPEVSVITQISYDHMNLLGNTLQEIAREKAGIFKRGVPVISAPQRAEVSEVLRECAAAVGSEIGILGEDWEFSFRTGRCDRSGVFAVVNLERRFGKKFTDVEVPLAGVHQAYNCGLVLGVFDILGNSNRWGVGVMDADRFLQGLSETSLAGRMEWVCESPRILIDGAHNGASVSAVMGCIGSCFSKREELVVIFGCAKGKDMGNMLVSVLEVCDTVIFTQAAGNPRAESVEVLEREFDKLAVSGKTCRVSDSLSHALDIAVGLVGNKGLICITGSFYLAGEAKKVVAEWISQQKSTE